MFLQTYLISRGVLDLYYWTFVFQIYVNNKAQIDPVLDQVKAKLNEVSDKVTALMPQGKAAPEPKKEE